MSLNFRKKKEDNLKNLELRKQFINFLEKLSDNNTRDIGNKGLKQLIIDNNNSYQALRIFLNSLMNFNTDNIKAKEIIILLYGYIGQIYENNLLDPIDNPPSLVHSINRIVSHIRNKHMKSNNYTILKSCSYSILQILDYCMPKNDIINLNKIFIEPFINDINNAFHIYVKNGCCLYINDLVYHLKKAKDYEIEMLKCILVDNKFISDVILKIKIDFFQNYFLYETVYNMILYFNFEFFRKDSINIIYKMIDILENKILLKKETKISCLKVLYILIQKYSENNYNINNKKEILKDVRDSVGNYIDDRIDEVRKVARDTIKLLNEVEFEEKKFDINNHTKKNEIEKFDNNKNYLKSNNIKKFNYYNKGPFFNENNYSDNMNKKEHFRKNKNNKNIFLTDDNFIAPTNLEDTSKYQSMINDNVQKKENKYINKYKKNSSKPKFDPSIYYSINVNDIYNSINDSKKLFLSFEKNINSKLYENENKLMKIQTSIEKNTNNIIKYHNNILNETIKSNYTQTEKDKNEIENTLLKTSEFNEEGKEYFRIYLKALKLFYKNNFNEAFSLIVDDDIYLLRLLFLAKNKLDIICPLLNKDLYKKMILKINHLCHSHFLIKIQKMLKNSINHKCNNNF